MTFLYLPLPYARPVRPPLRERAARRLLAAAMPARFAWWATCAVLARVAHRAARANVATLRWSARHAGRFAATLSAPAAAHSARRAMRTVPAFGQLVASDRPPLPARTAEGWLSQLPVTTKRDYVDRWSLEERCAGGRIPRRGSELDESSGSSGAPYTWVRGRRELRDVHRSLSLVARHILPTDGRPIVVLNAFSMGAWATGANVSAALTAIGTVKSCGPDVDKVLGAVVLLGPEPTYVVCGYPPFLRSLLDAAADRGLDLNGLSLHGFVGGEGMTESARARLERTFVRVWSAYGASDLDIGVAAETPISVWVRQRAAADPALALALFGRCDRLPMIFQYDPCDYYIETVGRELVVTVTRPILAPRIRYNVGDEGGTIDFAAAMRVCRAAGLDPSQAEADPFRLPFMFVHGRSDQTVSFMGANLYPEDIATGIGSHVEADRLGTFCVELTEVGDDEVRPCIHVESVRRDGELQEELVAAVRDHLAAASADYRTALAESSDAADLRVQLWAPGTGPFVANGGRIKHRHVLTAAR